MLTYAAIVPNTPLVFERISTQHARAFTETRTAMDQVAEDLYALTLDALIVISVHGERYQNALGIAYHDPFVATMRDVGELGMDVTFPPAARFIDTLQRGLRRRGIPTTLTTNDLLDHGSSVPLVAFHHALKQVPITVLTPPLEAPKRIIAIGEHVREVIESTGMRIGILAATSLSHRRSSLAPEGFHPDAEAFDTRIRQALHDGNTLPFSTIDADEMRAMGAVDLDALRLFVGILDATQHDMEERNFDAPLGIGQLVMVARLH